MFSKWEEISTGSRVIFTGTAHSKFEMTIMDKSFRDTPTVAFVGPLSKTVFSKLLTTYSRLDQTIKPITLNATDLNGCNETIIKLDFVDHETLKLNETSLGRGRGNVLTHCYENYSRFDFILGAMFIQVSVSNFAAHNRASADIKLAFTDKTYEGNTNQIEHYLNEVYGLGHSATIDGTTKKFIVTKDGEPVTGFRIVYIYGRPNPPNRKVKKVPGRSSAPGVPTHSDLVKEFPDILHVTYEELQNKFFPNAVK